MVIFYFFPYLFFTMIYFKALTLIYGVIFFLFIHFYLYLHMNTLLDCFPPTCDSFVMATEVFCLTAFHHSSLKAKSDIFFKFYFIFKLYIIVLVLPNIKMNPPQVYMRSHFSVLSVS